MPQEGCWATHNKKAVRMAVRKGMEKTAGRIQQAQVPKIWSLAGRKGGGTIMSDRDKQQKTGTFKLWAWGTSRSKAQFKTSA